MTEVVVFDLETTGVDVETDRIVSAYVGVLDDNGQPVPGFSREWLVNPGVDIPAAASAVHGITTERAQAEGMDPAQAADEIFGALVAQTIAGTPLVVFNAPFDLTLLDRELRRAGLPTFTSTMQLRVIDPLVIDKALERYRKGKRTLGVLAPLYGVEVGEAAHTADQDAIVAGRLAQVMLRRLEGRPRAVTAYQDIPLTEYLHTRQITWAAEHADSYQDYLRRTKDPAAVIDGSWPIRPWVEA